MACFIIGAGSFYGLPVSVQRNDMVIAADGGWHTCRENGITPTLLVADFDSLDAAPAFDHILRLPVEKDDTDSMLAVKAGLQAGYPRFLLYGVLYGPRLDHTVANFQLLHYLSNRNAYGYLVGSTYLATVLAPGRLRFPPEAGGILSVFCSGADASGVTLRGLQYPLEDAVLTAGFPLGVSNHFLGLPAEVSLKQGRLLLLWDRPNGLPERESLENGASSTQI